MQIRTSLEATTLWQLKMATTNLRTYWGETDLNLISIHSICQIYDLYFVTQYVTINFHYSINVFQSEHCCLQFGFIMKRRSSLLAYVNREAKWN